LRRTFEANDDFYDDFYDDFFFENDF